MIDPFANSIETQAEQQPVSSPVVTTEKPEGATSTAGLSITYKGTSRDPWIVIHAETVDDALATAADPRMPDLMRLVRKGSEFFVGTLPAKPDTDTSSAAQSAPGASQAGGKTNPPGVPAINCAHGPRNYVAKSNWAALFCSAPQGTIDSEKCEPLWRDKFGNYKAK